MKSLSVTGVECEFNIKRRTYLLSLDERTDRKVRAIAKKKRIPTESLVRHWIEKKVS
jgi:hypothetical protein